MKMVLAVQILFVVLLAFACYGGIPCGLRTFVVVSGSMQPSIPVGSLVYINCGVSGNEIEADDVIAFDMGGLQESICTHRVVENNIQDKLLTTKGDANPSDDPATVPYESVIGRAVFHIPQVGYVLSWVSDNRFFIICMMGATLAVVYMLNCLPLKGRRASKAKTKEASNGTTAGAGNM